MNAFAAKKRLLRPLFHRRRAATLIDNRELSSEKPENSDYEIFETHLFFDRHGFVVNPGIIILHIKG
jgi:hypothetical protein